MLLRLIALLISLSSALSLLTPDLPPRAYVQPQAQFMAPPQNPPAQQVPPERQLPPEILALSQMPSFPPEPRVVDASPNQPQTWAVYNPNGGAPLLQQAPLYPSFPPTSGPWNQNSPPNAPQETVSSDPSRVQQNFRIQQKGNRNDYNNVNARQVVKTAAINRSFIAQTDNKNLANNVLLDQRQTDGKNVGWVVQKNNNNIANFANIRQIREGEGENFARVVQDKNPFAYNVAKTQQAFKNTTYGNVAVTTKMDGLKTQVLAVKTQYIDLKSRKDLRDKVAKILGMEPPADPQDTKNGQPQGQGQSQSQAQPQGRPQEQQMAQPQNVQQFFDVQLQRPIGSDSSSDQRPQEPQQPCNTPAAPPTVLENVQNASQRHLEKQGFEFFPNQEEPCEDSLDLPPANYEVPLAEVIEPSIPVPVPAAPTIAINVGAANEK